jgi:hypothetical protein
MQGTIVMSSGRGWFFAESDDHRSIFIHQNDVEGQRFLRVDDRVELSEIIVPPTHPNKLQAKQVRYVGHCIAGQVAARDVVRP